MSVKCGKWGRVFGPCLCLTALYQTGCTELPEMPDFADGSADIGRPGDAGPNSVEPRDGASPGAATSGDGEVRGVDSGSEPPSACSEEGAVRCAASASSAREICRDGVWQGSEDCDPDEVCDTSNTDDPGTCVAASALCMGSAGELVCIDGVMHECNTDAISISQQTCESQAHCQMGLWSGQCAVCIPGLEHRCRGQIIEECAEDGMGYAEKEVCSDEAPCNEEAGACTSDFCLPGTFRCFEGQLLVCNATQTAYDVVDPCDSGVCDAVDGECDVCVAGLDKKCTEDGYPAVCNAEGQGWDVGSCDSESPICVGQGNCVDCLSASDCGPDKPICSSDTCVECTQNSHCDGEVCKVVAADIEQNECVQCVVSRDCGDTSVWECADNRCRELCGNGRLDPGEQCDDGSPTQSSLPSANDGCGVHCQINTVWGCPSDDDARRWVTGPGGQWVWVVPHPELEDLATCGWPCGDILRTWPQDPPYENGDCRDNPEAWQIPGTDPPVAAECINGGCIIPCGESGSCPPGYECKNPDVVWVDAWIENHLGLPIPTTNQFEACVVTSLFEE